MYRQRGLSCIRNLLCGVTDKGYLDNIPIFYPIQRKVAIHIGHCPVGGSFYNNRRAGNRSQSIFDGSRYFCILLRNVSVWITCPLGFGNWKATVASVSGLIAKENVVGTFGVLYHFGGEELSENGDEIWSLVAADYTALSAYAFMIFNLLCAPCFAAMGAIKREMNNGKWTAFAIGYMCALAYCSALVVYQLGGIITGELSFNFFTIVAAVILVAFIYLLVRPNKYVNDNEVKIDVSKIK